MMMTDDTAITPIPSMNRLKWLQQVVVALGGELHDDICRPVAIEYSMPGSPRTTMANTCACGNDAVVLLPSHEEGELGAQICLVCDGGAYMPVLT